MTDAAKPTAERILQVRRSHASAKPHNGNPAWQNTHADLSVVLAAYDQLAEQRDELLKALQSIMQDIDSEHGTDYDWGIARAIIAKVEAKP